MTGLKNRTLLCKSQIERIIRMESHFQGILFGWREFTGTLIMIVKPTAKCHDDHITPTVITPACQVFSIIPAVLQSGVPSSRDPIVGREFAGSLSLKSTWKCHDHITPTVIPSARQVLSVIPMVLQSGITSPRNPIGGRELPERHNHITPTVIPPACQVFSVIPMVLQCGVPSPRDPIGRREFTGPLGLVKQDWFHQHFVVVVLCAISYNILQIHIRVY